MVLHGQACAVEPHARIIAYTLKVPPWLRAVRARSWPKWPVRKEEKKRQAVTPSVHQRLGALTTSYSDADDHDRGIEQTSPCLVPSKCCSSSSMPRWFGRCQQQSRPINWSRLALKSLLSTQSHLVSFFDFEKSGNALFVQEFKSIGQKAGDVFCRVCIQEKHIIELEIPVDQKRTIF